MVTPQETATYFAYALSTTATKNFSAYIFENTVEEICADACREIARLGRLGRLPLGRVAGETREIEIPLDPLGSPSTRRVSIDRFKDLIVVIGDVLPKEIPIPRSFLVPEPKWVYAVLFSATYIAIEFNP